VRDRYNGNEQIHIASGSCMDIHHIGHYVIHTPHYYLHLNNILHVPQATKSLLSTSRLARDNHAFVEYWPNSFFVTDQDMREVLLQGRCVDGLYPLPSHLHHLLVIMSMVRPSLPRCSGIGLSVTLRLS
jgi:hypothetical protein